MLLKYFLFALIVSTASAATWRGKPPPKPQEFADKEGCYVKEINDVIPFQTTIRPIGYCYRITCSESLMNYASCGTVFTNDPKCYVTEKDLSKPYPECCPRIKCDTDNKL